MTIITTQLNIYIQDGPDISIPTIKIEVESYDKIDINIKSIEKKNFTIETVGSSNEAVSFLLITSSLYTPNDAEDQKKLTFLIGEEAQNPDESKYINLSYPQLYIGKDAIAELFGDVKKITFDNQLAKKGDETTTAQISVLIGRDKEGKKS